MMGKILRLAITALLLAVIIVRVDWNEFRVIGSEVRLDWIVLAYVLNLVMIAANTYRWQILVASLGTHVNAFRLGGYYFVCMFFNNFMPTSIGGDVMRVLDLSKHTGKKSSATASIMVERLLGLYALFPVGLLGFVLLLPDLPRRDLFLLIQIGTGLLFLVGTIAIRRTTVRALAPLFRPLLPLLERFGVPEKLGKLYDFLVLYRDRVGTVIIALLLSIFSRSIWVVGCWLFSLAVGLDHLSPMVFFLLMPIVELGRMLPISLSGMGIREGLFVIILDLFGVTATEAVFVCILVYGVFILNGLLGGIVYAGRGFLGSKAGDEPAGE